MSIAWVILALLIVCAGATWSGIREQYDAHMRLSDPLWPRFGGSNLDVARWYLARFRKPCDKAPAKRRPRRAF